MSIISSAEIAGYLENIVDVTDSARVKNNIQLLWDSQPGQEFYADQNGLLHRLTLKARVCRFCRRSSTEKTKVKARIHETLSNIDVTKISATSKAAFCETFFAKTAQLSQSVFNRGEAISTSLEEYLTGYLEEQEKKDAGSEVIVDDLYTRKVRSVRLAMRLGIDFKLHTGGSSGVYVGKDIHDKKVLAFKPEDEGPYGANCPFKWKKLCDIAYVLTYIYKRIARFLGIQVQRASMIPNYECVAEALASKTDEFFKLGIVPQTRLLEFSSAAFKGERTKTGSCQLWEEDLVPASDYYYTSWFKFKEKDSGLETQQLHAFFFLSLLIRDQDKGFDNWSIQHKDGKKHIVDYDHGFSFPKAHPRGVKSTRKQFLFKQMQAAQGDFTHIKAMITQASENIDGYIAFLRTVKGKNEEGQMVELFTKDQERVIRETVPILKHYADDPNGEGFTIKHLCKIKTQYDVDQFYTENPTIQRPVVV